ncbi:Phospholipase_D-nuclease N-terminal [Paenibacillaceae bacterium GAS479]|nr:Phospholipase_D-nuclease N-terminal [Paenibacillaceae bacterium GAS479]
MSGASIIGIGMLFFMLFLLVFQIVICVWGYRDAKSRGYSNEFALLVLIALLFFPVLGLIIYLIIRSDPNDRFKRY